MDSILRPKATAKRLKSRLQSAVSRKTLRNLAPSRLVHTEQLAYASPYSLTKRPVHHTSQLEDTGVLVAPSGPQLQNPYLNKLSLNWAELQEMDRDLYLLQKGAPPHGDTLPYDWTHAVVKKVLFGESVDPLDEVSSWDNTEILKARYESVRLGLQNFFNSKPEVVTKDRWTLSKIENFDVYNMKPGSKHRTAQRNDVRIPVNPTIDEASTPTTMQGFEVKTPNQGDVERGCGGNGGGGVGACESQFNTEYGMIVETEDNLVLDELLRSAEQYLGEESDHEFTTDIVAGKTVEEPSSVIPQAKALDPKILFSGGLDGSPSTRRSRHPASAISLTSAYPSLSRSSFGASSSSTDSSGTLR